MVPACKRFTTAISHLISALYHEFMLYPSTILYKERIREYYTRTVPLLPITLKMVRACATLYFCRPLVPSSKSSSGTVKTPNKRTVCYLVGVASSGKVWCFLFFLRLSCGVSSSIFPVSLAPFLKWVILGYIVS